MDNISKGLLHFMLYCIFINTFLENSLGGSHLPPPPAPSPPCASLVRLQLKVKKMKFADFCLTRGRRRVQVDSICDGCSLVSEISGDEHFIAKLHLTFYSTKKTLMNYSNFRCKNNNTTFKFDCIFNFKSFFKIWPVCFYLSAPFSFLREIDFITNWTFNIIL